MKTTTLLIFLYLLTGIGFNQTNVGLRKYEESVFPGYTLFTPEQNTHAYLIDNCGQKIHEWTFSDKPALTCYLLENGNLLRAGQDFIEIRDWNNNLIWSIEKDINFTQHHDIEPLPNGNILCIVSELFNQEEAIELGRDPSISTISFKLDKIIEIQPIGSNFYSIPWEWHFKDHLIQDYNALENNYGIVEDHPELLDANFDNGEASNYVHINAIDYNPVLDQIIISSRNLSELFIIDHSTTISEAASHSGGNSGKGGDFLWRWGNPQVYRAGTSLDQKLFFQHDCKWITSNCPDAGKISVFNNGGDGLFNSSSVHILEPVIQSFNYEIINSAFSPADFDWSWSGEILGQTMLESKKCGTMQLPNGNQLICETSLGQVTEIDNIGNVIWVYKNPSGTVIYQQDEFIENADNGIFRAEKYGVDYPAFNDKTLQPIGIIEEENVLSESCILQLTTKHDQLDKITVLNPVFDKIIFNENLLAEKIQVVSVDGRVLFNESNFDGKEIDFDGTPGSYFVIIRKDAKIMCIPVYKI